MKKFVTFVSCIIFIASFGFSLFAAEKPSSSEKPKTSATPAQPATPATPAQPATEKNVEKAVGEITNIDTTANTIKIKKEDGTEITLKATTPKIKEEVKKYKVGDKVNVIYKKTKEGDNVLLKISAYKEVKPKK